MPKKTAIGVVTSDKMIKTRRVEIARLVKHPRYGKYVRRRTVCYVHDEGEQSAAGDTVEIIEARPRSRTKRWELVRIVRKASQVDLAALRAGRREREAGAEDQALTDQTPSGSEPQPGGQGETDQSEG